VITIHTSKCTNFVFSCFLISLSFKTVTSFSILFLALAKPDLLSLFVQCSITYLCIYQWHTIVNITAWRPGKSYDYLASSFAFRRHNAMHFRLSVYSRSSLYLSITASLQLRSHHSITVSIFSVTVVIRFRQCGHLPIRVTFAQANGWHLYVYFFNVLYVVCKCNDIYSHDKSQCFFLLFYIIMFCFCQTRFRHTPRDSGPGCWRGWSPAGHCSALHVLRQLDNNVDDTSRFSDADNNDCDRVKWTWKYPKATAASTAVSHWSVLHLIRQLVRAKSLHEGDKNWHRECTTRLSVASAETGSETTCAPLYTNCVGNEMNNKYLSTLQWSSGHCFCWLQITQ